MVEEKVDLIQLLLIVLEASITQAGIINHGKLVQSKLDSTVNSFEAVCTTYVAWKGCTLFAKGQEESVACGLIRNSETSIYPATKDLEIVL